MELHEMLKNIKIEGGFYCFLKELKSDCLSNNLEWENTTIDKYFDFISG
jgi:hypothetical protein